MTCGWAFFSFYPITVFPVLEGIYPSDLSPSVSLTSCSAQVEERIHGQHGPSMCLLDLVHGGAIPLEARPEEEDL
jgi:hypothetical protein